MKNKHLELMGEILSDIKDITFAEARIRDKFVKELQSKAKEREENRNKILEKLGKVNQEKNVYEFETPEDNAKALEEIAVLFDEDVNMEITIDLKEIAERTNYKPKVGEMELIDEILK